MEETASDAGSVPAQHLSIAEIEMRRYEARLGVWKVVLGTMVIGIAGVLIPGAVNFSTLLFENWRKEDEFRLAQRTAHQQYIKDFFDTAINQDIELRIRFANYFANLSGDDQRQSWTVYLKDIKDQRQEKRKLINELEGQLVALKRLPEGQSDVAEIDRVVRELNWSYSEIGYVPLDRSLVSVIAGKKERLYLETAAVVTRLAALQQPIDVESADYGRFWTLYRKDLIGIESRNVAAKMIATGAVLQDLVTSKAQPSEELKTLSAELGALIRDELSGVSIAQPSRAQTAN
ncbi:hypothetical protein [Rhizobium leguminosarum]|uniref:hypothetical protein n=1 Tax=Rhizobium leguminosarum TaxID=384 RepID=UPI001C97A08F|nr:hypothetical protein [Rhizobium leguminosarum]MBY5581178.1 hypothetical protein [Rhizobium leguminosarum]MBY5704377.1 hypothetical protein [Rhizobium leguminosarum]MBY5719161.1 hypothetical protein [Rhizobium leguminosarum]